jgi:hypothetical protein
MNGSQVVKPVQATAGCGKDHYSDLNRTEALVFLRNARAVLLGLHGLGIVHGDPGCQNFLHGESGVSLIDLDDVHYTGRLAASWELRKFLLRTAIPVLKRHGSANDITGVWMLRDFLAFVVGVVAHLFWRGCRVWSLCRDRVGIFRPDKSTLDSRYH